MAAVMIGVMAVVLIVGMLGFGGHHGGSGGHHGKINENVKQKAVTQHDNSDMEEEKQYPHEDTPLRETDKGTTVAEYHAGDEKEQPFGDAAEK